MVSLFLQKNQDFSIWVLVRSIDVPSVRYCEHDLKSPSETSQVDFYFIFQSSLCFESYNQINKFMQLCKVSNDVLETKLQTK